MISRSAYELAYRYQLTGLKGRRAMDEHLQALGRHYAIAMIDIVHFKRFNDTHGHEIGDEVLKMVALEIDQVGGGGSAYRYGGGEEFSVLEDRSVDFFESEPVRHFAKIAEEPIPATHLLGIEITGTAWGL